ncbi:KRAB-A domain-containing protein 2-like [Gigantopelta aegis]|uniref:KRAB-A domain-containing protein 2-like n=1 Tax=Gigantopelta aegis TaxID=1735272 RepID=UPI001B8878C8|nr:KRAB-A domain-containing protein 2-like [Gigantopelta aegis]
MVHGKPRHPQCQGSVERLNCDVKDMLIAWLGDNNSTDWPMGLRFVQFQKNCSYHSSIKQTPYKALFGTGAWIGLCTCAIPTEILECMVSEEDLIAAYATTDSSSNTDAAESSGTEQTTVNVANDIPESMLSDGQMAQAERMVKRSRVEHVAGNPGDNVTIPIPLDNYQKIAIQLINETGVSLKISDIHFVS